MFKIKDGLIVGFQGTIKGVHGNTQYDMLKTLSDGSVNVYGYHGTMFANNVNGATYLYTSGTGTHAATLSSNYLQSNGSLRAPIFYDSNNTAYYTNPASTSWINSLTVNGTMVAKNGVQVPYTAGTKEQMIVLDGATTYGLFHTEGTNDSFSFDFAGSERLNINQTGELTIHGAINRAATLFLKNSSQTTRQVRFGTFSNDSASYFGPNNDAASHQLIDLGVSDGRWRNFDMSGTAYIRSSTYSPIYYDLNNTAYYVDPASTSQMNHVDANHFRVNAGDGLGVGFWGNPGGSDYSIYMSSQSNATYGGRTVMETTSDYNMYFRMGGGTNRGFVFRSSTNNVAQIDASGNGYFEGNLFVGGTGTDAAVRLIEGNNGWNMRHRASDNSLRFSNIWGGTDHIQVTEGGNATFTTDIRTPRLYDSNNTGYYCDPASTSMFWQLNSYQIGIHNSDSTTGKGISLYGGASNGEPTYGMMFAGTGTFGTHGSVTGSWATYFTMNNDNSRGWIFRKVGSGNVASISGGGNIYANGDVSAYSDRRVKTKIEVIPEALKKVQKLSGYTYERTDFTNEDGTPVTQTGVIAQEVLEVLPEAVRGSEEDHYSVAYGNMVGLLIEAIKEQQVTIEKQQQQIDTLVTKCLKL